MRKDEHEKTEKFRKDENAETNKRQKERNVETEKHEKPINGQMKKLRKLRNKGHCGKDTTKKRRTLEKGRSLATTKTHTTRNVEKGET